MDLIINVKTVIINKMIITLIPSLKKLLNPKKFTHVARH